MDQKKLEYFINHPGFIAALDQSGGSTPKTLLSYGIDESAYSNDEEMFDLVHAMRTRVMTSSVFNSNRLVGTILFKNTAERMINGKLAADYLWEDKQIVPFIKIDQGLADRQDGVQLMKSMDQVEALLDFTKDHRALGTKERSVIWENNPVGIKNIVDQQFDLAEKAIAKGILPILEPEISISAPDKAAAEDTLLKYIEERVAMLSEHSPIAIKITLPEKDNLYLPLLRHKNVVKVVALSGGYSREQACEKLKRNQQVIASFCRALLDGLKVDQSETQFNAILDASMEMAYQASVNKISN